ncbi:hypothetical protein [Brachybacterium nesterenkovii]|uniref:hypothetical protein n=1 Tax=Brachybacterium nesterenkovii TaxID=47847 RepID=UPI00321B1734
MSKTSIKTRQTITTSYRFNPHGATIDDLRQFVERTVNLPAGSPLQTEMLASGFEVHQTLESTPEDLGKRSADPSDTAEKIIDRMNEARRRGPKP